MRLTPRGRQFVAQFWEFHGAVDAASRRRFPRAFRAGPAAPRDAGPVTPQGPPRGAVGEHPRSRAVPQEPVRVARGYRNGTLPPVARLTIRIDLSDHGAIGPGKIRLLELIGESGSISAAGRAMNMSYRHAWLLIDGVNRCFRVPVVETQLGGARAGAPS